MEKPFHSSPPRPSVSVLAPPIAVARLRKAAPEPGFSVVLEADEDVEWTWTYDSDGCRYVSGLTILKKAPH